MELDQMSQNRHLCYFRNDTHYCIREFPHDGIPHELALHHGGAKK